MNVEIRGVGCVVCEEKNALARCTKVVDEADSEGENVVAEINSTVHIKDLELFFVENCGIGILECHFSSPFYKYFLKYYITDLIFLQEFDIISV